MFTDSSKFTFDDLPGHLSVATYGVIRTNDDSLRRRDLSCNLSPAHQSNHIGVAISIGFAISPRYFGMFAIK